MRNRRLGPAAAFLTAALGLLPLAACVPPPPGAVFVRFGPPPARVEVIGVAPGPGYFWIAGHWAWSGRAYFWVPGSWERRPRPRARWVPGHWRHGRRGWFWAEGRWR